MQHGYLLFLLVLPWPLWDEVVAVWGVPWDSESAVEVHGTCGDVGGLRERGDRESSADSKPLCPCLLAMFLGSGGSMVGGFLFGRIWSFRDINERERQRQGRDKRLLYPSSLAAGWRDEVSPNPVSGACTPRAMVDIHRQINSFALKASTRF